MRRHDDPKPKRNASRRTGKPQSADPGPVPISPGQRTLRAAMRGEPAPPPANPKAPAEPVRVTRFRDAGASRKRVNLKNRRKPNYLAWTLNVLSVAAAAGGIAYLLLHPRFDVGATSGIRVTGNEAVTKAAVQDHFKGFVGKNLFLLPMDRVQKAAVAEPTVESATVGRTLPNRLWVKVVERQPFASVQLPDGTCYTMDAKLVPFRKTEVPENALPVVHLSPREEEVAAVTLDKKMQAPGLADVQKCLEWGATHPEFPVESISIDPTGKLCLNRTGGMQVRLGSGRDLDRKLETLALLMARRPEVQVGAAVAYVNLFSFDAPAILPRTPRTPAQKGTDGKGAVVPRVPAVSASSDAQT